MKGNWLNFVWKSADEMLTANHMVKHKTGKKYVLGLFLIYCNYQFKGWLIELKKTLLEKCLVIELEKVQAVEPVFQVSNFLVVFSRCWWHITRAMGLSYWTGILKNSFLVDTCVMQGNISLKMVSLVWRMYFALGGDEIRNISFTDAWKKYILKRIY